VQALVIYTFFGMDAGPAAAAVAAAAAAVDDKKNKKRIAYVINRPGFYDSDAAETFPRLPFPSSAPSSTPRAPRFPSMSQNPYLNPTNFVKI